MSEPAIETLLLAAHDARALPTALQALRAGEVVALPTDTVYGVACDPWSVAAIERLYWAKLRPAHMAIPVLVASVQDVAHVAQELPRDFDALAECFWPGGLTLIVPKAERVPALLCADGATIAVRWPDHAMACALIAAFGGALAVTSANLSGQPAARTAYESWVALQGRVAVVLDGGLCRGGVASTIVDLTAQPPRVARVGAIPVEALQAVLPELAGA